jgi:hypothetical protein
VQGLKSSWSVCLFLVADIGTAWLQLNTHGRHRVPACPAVLAHTVAVLPPNCRAMAMALWPVSEPLPDATAGLGGLSIHLGTGSGLPCPAMLRHAFCRARA